MNDADTVLLTDVTAVCDIERVADIVALGVGRGRTDGEFVRVSEVSSV
jgi:hypothetical protein